jgi:hypothetical protein
MINSEYKYDPEEDNNIADLDTTWIERFEEMEKDYNNYYTEELSFIRVNYIYVNKNSEIINISEEKYLFKKPGILYKEELIGLIKRHTVHNSIKYSLLSLLKFIIDFEPIHLKTFIRTPDKNVGKQFLQSLTNIDNIVFQKSITLFHDINNLYIIFIDKNENSGPGHGALSSNHISHRHNTTKKIYINYLRKQTKRNQM